jgi:peptidoglycan/LPS O-acetylase OafA/YrhL
MPELDPIRGVAVLLVIYFHGFAPCYNQQRLAGLPKLIVLASLPG